MIIHVCVQTINRSITVTTLHMLLNLTCFLFSRGHSIEIHYTDSIKTLERLIKSGEKVLWVSYGSSLDGESFGTLIDTKYDVVVYPAVKENVNWSKFKENIDSSEPKNQIALEFDTELSNKIKDFFWTIKSTNPSIFFIDCKSVNKKMIQNKMKFSNDVEVLFQRFLESKIQCVAYTLANITVQRQHECIGNILESFHVKTC